MFCVLTEYDLNSSLSITQAHGKCKGKTQNCGKYKENQTPVRRTARKSYLLEGAVLRWGGLYSIDP